MGICFLGVTVFGRNWMGGVFSDVVQVGYTLQLVFFLRFCRNVNVKGGIVLVRFGVWGLVKLCVAVLFLGENIERWVQFSICQNVENLAVRLG